MINRVIIKMDNKVYSIQVDSMMLYTDIYCNSIQFEVYSYMNAVTYALAKSFDKHKETEVTVHVFKDDKFKLKYMEVTQQTLDLPLVHLTIHKPVKPNIALDDTIGGFYD